MKATKKQVEELVTRGVADVIGRDELEKALLSGRKLRVKLGIDPTSPNLHLGRAVNLLKLRDFQQLGHQIIFIVGDFTGTIGDTSDKESERPMLSRETVLANMKSYAQQAGLLLDTKSIDVEYNSKWLGKLGYFEICEQAEQFSLSEFIARENIKRRLNAGQHISLREVLYPLMQGYDSVFIRSDVELGGTDQRFNMLAGRRLQEHYHQKPQSIIASNLILGTDGRKMSSSWGNTINLTDEPGDMFGKIMSIPDKLIVAYFIHCTRVPMDEVRRTEVDLKRGVNPRDAKMRLAKEIATLYHGSAAAEKAEQAFVALFQKHEAPTDIPELVLREGLLILEILVAAGFAASKGEARRLVKQGGVSLDGEIVTDEALVPKIPAQGATLQKGKRHFIRILCK